MSSKDQIFSNFATGIILLVLIVGTSAFLFKFTPMKIGVFWQFVLVVVVAYLVVAPWLMGINEFVVEIQRML